VGLEHGDGVAARFAHSPKARSRGSSDAAASRLDGQIVFTTLSCHFTGSRVDRMTFASGKAASCSRQRLQDGQSTLAR
jgi:hypothetical protein